MELMLRQDWPASFRRRVVGGVLDFSPGVPVTVTDQQLMELLPDIGNALFEVERDPKGRPRMVESDAVAQLKMAAAEDRQRQAAEKAAKAAAAVAGGKEPKGAKK